MTVSFRVMEPRAAEIPVVVEVPHAGLALDALAMSFLSAPVRCIGSDADLYVDELYEEAPSTGQPCWWPKSAATCAT